MAFPKTNTFRIVFRSILALAIPFSLATFPARAAIPPSEAAALMAFYDSSGGPNWSRRDGWGFSPGTECSWYGVQCNEALTTVVALYMGGNNLTATPVLGGLPGLKILDLNSNNLEGTFPVTVTSLPALEELRIAGSGLKGAIPAALGSQGTLTQLKVLHLHANELSGPIPAELSNLASLEELYLYSNQLTSVPASLGRLTKLRQLFLGYNQLTGTIPRELSGLTDVRELYLVGNQLTGSIPPELGGLRLLEALDLSSNRLTGAIPAALSGATALTSLNLSYNELEDAIPTSLGQLTHLATLALNNNKLTGGIPPQLGNLRDLTGLFLSSNQLSGSVPAELGNLAKLERLTVSYNQLTSLPFAALSRLPKLDSLYVDHNPYGGPVPAELGASPALVRLDLSSCGFTGSIPATFGGLSKVEELSLAENELTGTVPFAFGSLARLASLDLSRNKLSGGLPESLSTLSSLRYLRLWGNEFTGPIPASYGSLSALEVLDVDYNKLSGGIPKELSRLTRLQDLYLDNNELSGAIPPELGNLPALRQLYLNTNRLSGAVPATLGNLVNLDTLHLEDNQLSGGLPGAILGLAKLTYLNASRNQISGQIPGEIGGLSELRLLALRDNQLRGGIPDELGNLPNLTELYLDGNLLSGPIPGSLGNLTNIEALYLNANQLTGSIPPELGNLAKVRDVQLGYNLLSGPIPRELGNMAALERLSLPRNRLSGPLPAELSRLARLDSLDLSANRIGGAIPSQLGSLPALRFLDLQGNVLSGEIPTTLANLTNLYDGYGVNLRWNALRTQSASLRSFLIEKGGNFDDTQTTAPPGLNVGVVSTASVTLRWSPILYQDNQGGYRVLYARAGGSSYELGATTSNKRVSSATVPNLTPGVMYNFVVQTFTNPHDYNPNRVESDPSAPIAATTSAPGSVTVALSPASLRVLANGSANLTATVSPTRGSATTLTLASSNTSLATVPQTLTVPAGSASATFRLNTGGGTGSLFVTAALPADLGGGSAAADIVVDYSTCERPDTPSFPSDTPAPVRAGNPINLSWSPTLASDPTGTYQVEVTTDAQCDAGRVRYTTPEPSLSIPTETGRGVSVCAIVRAVSSTGCASSDSQPYRVTVQPSPAAFILAQAQRPEGVTVVGSAPPNGTVVFKNIGSEPAAFRVASRIGLFTPSPESFPSVPPGGTATVGLIFDPLSTAAPAVLFDSLCGTWGDAASPKTVCTAVTMTALAAPPSIEANGGALQLSLSNEVHFIAPPGGTPPTQPVTIANPGTSPVRLAPSIGPGGAWLNVSGDFASPIPPGASRTFTLTVDRSRRATGDGNPPLTTNLTFLAVDGPTDQRVRAVVQVFDEEPGTVANGTNRGFLRSNDYSMILPSGVSAPGAGTYFFSDGWIRNTGATAARAEIYYTPNGGDGIGHPQVKRATVNLPAYSTYRLADFVRGLFSTTGSGSVEIRSPQIANLSIRTTIDSLTQKAGGFSRFGAEIPTTRSREGASLGKGGGASLHLTGLKGGAGSGFRTNIILSETSGRPLTIGLTLRDADGAVLGETTQTVLAYSKLQINNNDPVLFPGTNYEGGSLEVKPLEGIGSVAAFATVIDNVSQGYTTRTGRALLSQSPAATATREALRKAGLKGASPNADAFTRLVVPAAAHAQGLNNSFFTTNVSLTNGTATSATIDLRYLPDPGRGDPPPAKPVTIPPRKTVTLTDVVASLFGVTTDTAGMILLEGRDVQKLAVASETQTLLQPNSTAKGASPSTLSAYAPESVQAIGDPRTGLPSAVVSHPGLEESTRFRTNLILAEIGGAKVTVRVRLLLPGSGGVPLAEQTYELAALQRLQIGKFIQKIAGTQPGAVEYLDVETTVEWLSGAGRVIAVASKIDNDPESKRSDLYVFGPTGSAQGSIGF